MNRAEEDATFLAIAPIVNELARTIRRAPTAAEQFAATCTAIIGLLMDQSDEAAEAVFAMVRSFRAERAETRQ